MLNYALNSLKCFRHNYSSFWLINIWMRLVVLLAMMKKSMWPVGGTVKPYWSELLLKSVREEGSVSRHGLKRAVDGSVWVQPGISGLTSAWTVVKPERHVTSEVLTALTVNNSVYLVMPCSLVEIHRRFWGTSEDFYRTTRRHNPEDHSPSNWKLFVTCDYFC
jgi:hypothetical protein